MSIFLLVIFSAPLLNVLWWFWADRRVRRATGAPRSRGRSAGRIAIAAFAGSGLLLYAWLMAGRRLDVPRMPMPLLVYTYVWHLVVIPLTAFAIGSGTLLAGIGRLALWIARRSRPNSAPAYATIADALTVRGGDSATHAAFRAGPRPTRRQVLALAAVGAPPLLTGLGSLRAWQKRDEFRVRHIEVPLATLPPALDGLTIAHVSDTHVGRFTHGRALRAVAEQTNAMNADLVLFTGDLIDFTLGDLPEALDMLRRLDPRSGLFLCEGNHDLFESREGFERGVRDAGFRLLLNESATIALRGVPVQILGQRWGGSRSRPGPAADNRPGDSDTSTAAGAGPSGASVAGSRFLAHVDENFATTMRLRDRSAFQILLAHHPHAFDDAAAAGIPLTLAGHTHGGQLMLTRQIGVGALMFKYCSGLYRQGDAALVVSNGVGNWFPLRVNAPAEIIHLTLRRT
jgi:hypothetical protein